MSNNKENMQILQKGIEDYFDFMFENKSEKTISQYTYDSFLDFNIFFEGREAIFLKGLDIHDFSEDEVSLCYGEATAGALAW